jgi:hypothetical protein
VRVRSGGEGEDYIVSKGRRVKKTINGIRVCKAECKESVEEEGRGGGRREVGVQVEGRSWWWSSSTVSRSDEERAGKIGG